MLPQCFRLLALCALVICGGCATALTVDAIHPWIDTEGSGVSDYVADVTAAYRDGAGNVRVCVIGMPAGANHWLGYDRDYSLVYPAAESPDLTVVFHETIPQYQVTAADVKGRCPEAMPDMTLLPIHQVDVRDFGDDSYFGMSDAALAEFFESVAAAPAIYKFENGPNGFGTRIRVVYVPDSPMHRPARAVEIGTWARAREGQFGYVLLLPFALVFDVVTSPIQILYVVSNLG